MAPIRGKAGGKIQARADAARNAARQAAYRKRHLQDFASVDSERLNMVVPISTKRQLERLARHYGVTQKDVLARLLADADSQVLDGLDPAQQTAYYNNQS